MFKLLTAEILVATPIIITWARGHFHVIDRYSEEFEIRRAIPPDIFFQNIHRQKQAIADWEADQRRQNVIPLNPEQLQRLSGS